MIDDPFAVTELPWPRKGDVLFEHASDWYHNACVNWQFDNWDLYATGYKTAGDILVQYVIDTHSKRDTLLFPIAFNYRQYLELRCKEIIRFGRMLSDEPGEFPHTHDLHKLWTLCRDMVTRNEPSASNSDLEAIAEAIAQFCEIDRNSESFRYPVNRKGDRSLPENLRVVNLRQLRDVMNRVASFFDGASMALSAYLDYKAEMHNSSW